MKRICTFLLILGLVVPLIAQEPVPEVEEVEKTEEVKKVEEAAEAEEAVEAEEAPVAEEAPADTTNVPGVVEIIEGPDKTRVSMGSNEVLIVEENGDSTLVALGSMGISITENNDGGVEINILDMEEKREERKKKRGRRFDPHWAGLELGMNNYVTPSGSLSMDPGNEFMNLNTGKSWNWNINFVDFGIGLGSKNIGLTSGLGFEFNNYIFDGQNSIMKDTTGTGSIVGSFPDYAGNINKSKLYVSYITIPLILEFHIPVGNNKLRISGGVIAGAKMCSSTKIKYTESGEKSKEKNKNDYNLSPLRWGATARVGYGSVSVFANLYLTPLFKNNMGPELYPFTVGLAITP